MLAAGIMASLKSAATQDVKKIRPPAVAGMFYPSDAGTLTSMMEEMLARVSLATIESPIVALIAPHAGYGYSGPVAAWGYAAVRSRKYGRVVVIAPSHHEAFGYSSVFDGDAYETPLGLMRVDKNFVQKLSVTEPRIRISEKGHTSSQHPGEHALEVQLPWLQHVLGDVALVPIIMGDQSYSSARLLGMAVARAIASAGESGTLIVASSDLSHYHDYETAESKDRKVLRAIEQGDLLNLSRMIESGAWEACGGGAMVASMIAAEHLTASRAAVLQYANSGDVSHDKSHVVGYGSIALVQGVGNGDRWEDFGLSGADRVRLLRIARKSIETMLQQHRRYQVEVGPGESLRCERGVFVTLRKAGELRGCIGYTAPSEPLFQSVIDATEQAAFRDPRFPMVSREELPELRLEISVLNALRPVLDVRKIRPGIHGLLVKKGRREGLLLPQVALENGWDATKFLEQTCLKAGLAEDGWKDTETDVFRFTASVFREEGSDGAEAAKSFA